MNIRVKGSAVQMPIDQWCQVVEELHVNGELRLNVRSLGDPSIVWTIKIADINGVRLMPNLTVGVTTGLIRHTRSRTFV